jgi:hypothetical protein
MLVREKRTTRFTKSQSLDQLHIESYHSASIYIHFTVIHKLLAWTFINVRTTLKILTIIPSTTPPSIPSHRRVRIEHKTNIATYRPSHIAVCITGRSFFFLKKKSLNSLLRISIPTPTASQSSDNKRANRPAFDLPSQPRPTTPSSSPWAIDIGLPQTYNLAQSKRQSISHARRLGLRTPCANTRTHILPPIHPYLSLRVEYPHRAPTVPRAPPLPLMPSRWQMVTDTWSNPSETSTRIPLYAKKPGKTPNFSTHSSVTWS